VSLTPETIQTLSSSVAHLRGDSLVEEVLSAIVGLGEVPFAWKDVKAICREVLGDGEALRDAEKAFDRRVSKVDRGLYVLRGSAPRLASRSATAPSAPRIPSPKVSKPEGISWNPKRVDQDPQRESWYSDDAGLRRIALQSTKCFESWSEEATCGTCPLARWCQEASLAKLEELARSLDAESELLIAEEEAPELNLEEASFTQLEELEASLVEEPSSPTNGGAADIPRVETPAPPEEALLALQARGIEASRIPMPFGGVCSGCQAPVPADTDSMIHVRNKGIFHPACIQALL
jgi:hypothetical protein